MNRTNAGEMPRETHGGFDPPALNCPACGAAARRTDAHYCATCGRALRERAYAPADSLLASYHQQRNRPAMLFETTAASVSVQSAARVSVFDNGGNVSAAIAFVLICSALVPFVGILFCPLAIFAGGVGLFEAWLVPRVGGARLAACCIGSGFLIAGFQVLLFQLI
ncbi:MAG TPA: hypothetical protein VGW12_04550 [Pyrinomonadaceae bacterium]|nr:hypothetical protein [Pyrinomonadaceae bacterium]